MQSRWLWPIVGAAAVVVVVASYSGAQRPERPDGPPMGGPFGPGPAAGRYVVAHGSATQVLILDTATGRVYKVTEKEFKPSSELPRVFEGPRPPFRDGPRDRPIRREERKKDDKPARDDRPKTDGKKADDVGDTKGSRPAPLKYDVDRIEDVTVPGPVDPAPVPGLINPGKAKPGKLNKK